MIHNRRLYSVINRSTGEVVSIPANNSQEALMTIFILREENGEQQNLPSWYYRNMLIIELNSKSNLLHLGDWTITMEKENEPQG